MKNNSDIIVSVNDLSKRNYFIPSYQRGYRWESQQVTDLLDDIYDFSLNKDSQDYYCLQPIVVKKMSQDETNSFGLNEVNENEWYEVIDGQQRLTTIALIRHFFNSLGATFARIPVPKIKYETRVPFVEKMAITETEEAICEGIDDIEIDISYAINAYQIIFNWIKQLGFENIDKFKGTFNQDVKVIWYEINDNSENSSDTIELFTRINMGKIPLTNAELIKALFLRQRNFDSNKELRQIEIAKEWDSMEYALQNDDFWYFLNKKGGNKPARIEYVFDMMYNKELYKIKDDPQKLESFNKRYGTDDYKTFRFFADKFKTASTSAVKNSWEDVQNCFSAIKEWFDDPIYYHYIGYLITCGVSIVEIFSMYDNSPKDKFLEKVKERIKTTVKDVHYNITKDTESEKEVVSFDLSYDNDKEKGLIKKLLLLFNIQYMINHNTQSEQWYIRFPFDLYKKQEWDIEHINSFTTYEITKGEDQVAWINTALADLRNIGKNIEEIDSLLYSDIEKFKANTVNSQFPSIKARIAKHAGEDIEEDDNVKNNIGNLTLLNAEINRGYGNSLFVTKRKEIINKDKQGCFIPICTKNIFLKYYDTEGSTKTVWSKGDGDHDKYLLEIKETLKEFITNEVE